MTARRLLLLSSLVLSSGVTLFACGGGDAVDEARGTHGEGAIGSKSEALVAACTEADIRADAPPSSLPFFDKAFAWVHSGLMYCECTESGSSGYRADCSGMVSYAWGLPAPGHTTYSLAGGPWDDHKSVKISWGDLTAGDALNFPGDPSTGVGHVMLFGGWLDAAHTKFCSVEESSTGSPAHIGKHTLSDPGSWWGGSGTFADIFLPIRLSGYTPTPPDAPPNGSLDAVDCASIGGWTQDPDEPTKTIAAHLYFDGPAGDAKATGIALTADQSRDDLCKPLGSCDHAFSLAPPRSLLDGKSHDVYAYGIDSAGGANTELPGAPKTLKCDAPNIEKTWVKRHIVDPTILKDWKLDTFLDVAPYSSAALAAVTDGVAFDAPPSLVKLATDPAIYVSDHGFKRHVVDPASMSAWRFAAADVKTIDAASLAALGAGPDWPKTPLLANDPSAPPIYALDVPFPAPPGSADAGASDDATTPTRDAGVVSPSPSPSPTNDANANGGDMGGSCSYGAPAGSISSWIFGLIALSTVLRRRRDSRG